MSYLFIHLIVLFLSGCSPEGLTPANVVPHIYMDFERHYEPFETLAERPVDAEAENNGCMSGTDWNEYYEFNVCVAATRKLSDHVMERSAEVQRAGSHSLRVVLTPTPINTWPLGQATHRAELAPRSKSPVRHYPREGEERWYGMSVYFPEDFKFTPGDDASDLRFIIAQWHHGTPGSPSVALEVYGDRLAVARSDGVSTDSRWIEPQYLTRISRGQWMDIVVRIVWSKQDGKVQIWIDDKERISLDEVQTIYENLDVGGGMKFGLYYWRWKYRESVLRTKELGIEDREIFFDEIRQYLGPDGYKAALPGHVF